MEVYKRDGGVSWMCRLDLKLLRGTNKAFEVRRCYILSSLRSNPATLYSALF